MAPPSTRFEENPSTEYYRMIRIISRPDSGKWSRRLTKNKGIVLVDFHQMNHHRIAYAYLLGALNEAGANKVVAYRGTRLHTSRQSRWLSLKLKLGFLPASGTEKIYRALGASAFVAPTPSRYVRSAAKRMVSRFRADCEAKEELLRYSIGGVRIGDLAYDHYCKSSHSPTVNLEDEDFWRFLEEASAICLFWQEFFAAAQVRAVLGNAVYLQGIALRVALQKQIDVFAVSQHYVDRLSADNQYEDNSYLEWKNFCDHLPPKFLRAVEELGARFLASELAGDEVPTMQGAYSGRSPFLRNDETLANEMRIKDGVLVAPHNFFDSTHIRGEHLFPDYYSWLDYLGSISNSLPFRLFVKPHPDGNEVSNKVLEEIMSRYPELHRLDPLLSPKELFEMGFRYVLTVRGTLGGLYPALGYTVLNASMVNTRVSFDFNLNPKTRREYDDMLSRLPTLSLPLNRDQIAQHYFMRNIWSSRSLFLDLPQEINYGDTTWWQDELHSFDPVFDSLVREMSRQFVGSHSRWMRFSASAADIQFRNLTKLFNLKPPLTPQTLKKTLADFERSLR